MFVYQKFTKENLAILDTFIISHEKYNNNATIFIFTNLDISKFKFSHKVKIIYLPYTKFKIMNYRVLFNYHIFLKFHEFKKIYIFDTDLIAIKNYTHISDKSFDVGVTIANNWLKRKAVGHARAVEYHISNFHPDIQKQIIEKLVTNPLDQKKLLTKDWTIPPSNAHGLKPLDDFKDWARLPVYDVHAAAGAGTLVQSEYQIGVFSLVSHQETGNWLSYKRDKKVQCNHIKY